MHSMSAICICISFNKSDLKLERKSLRFLRRVIQTNRKKALGSWKITPGVCQGSHGLVGPEHDLDVVADPGKPPVADAPSHLDGDAAPGPLRSDTSPTSRTQ